MTMPDHRSELEPVTPCGGCGNDDPSKRCLGCLHKFTSADGWTAREKAGEVEPK